MSLAKNVYPGRRSSALNAFEGVFPHYIAQLVLIKEPFAANS